MAALSLACASLPLAAQESEAEAPAVETGEPVTEKVQEPAPAPAPMKTPGSSRLADFKVEADAPIPSHIPTENFAGRSTFRGFNISPDGQRLVVISDRNGMTDIIVRSSETFDKIKHITLSEEQGLDWLEWAGNGKLIMSISSPGFYAGYPVRVNRIFVRDLATDAFFTLEVGKRVFWGGDLVHLADDGSHALISVQKSLRETPSVYYYKLEPEAEPIRVVKPKTGVWNWYADDDGVVRIGMGWRNKRLRVYYRADADAKFDLVGKLKRGDEITRYWSVVRIVSGSDQGYVLEEGETGRVGVRLFDYAKGEVVETFYENPEWDVDELWINEDGSPRAAIYTDDRERIVWFDEAEEKRYNALKKALKQEDLSFVTRSRNNERSVVWAGSEADPGALYVYTPEAKTLNLMANYRPELDFTQLVKPQAFKYKSRDGWDIHSYLTLPRGREATNLPLIILPHGGPYDVRDTLSYNDEVQVLANRGYAVLQPNFRGSGGYGDAFYEAGTGEIGRKMQDDLDDAMDWAVGEGIADPKRVCVVGGSYGGYAALWAVTRNPERYRCAASWAGVTDLKKQLRYDRKFFSGKGKRAWRDRVRGEEDFDLDNVSPAEFAMNLNRPVLLAHGTRDRTVPFSQYKEFEKASRNAPMPPQTLVIEDEGHGFSSTENEKQWYDALTGFLAKHNPADAAVESASEEVAAEEEAVPAMAGE